MDADRNVARQAGHQHGLLTRQQARDAGLSYRQVQTRLATGRWEVLRPRVYRVSGAPRSWHGEVLAAVLAAGPGNGASHATAARLHDRAVALANGRRGVNQLVRLTAPGADAAFRSWLEREGARVLAEGACPRWSGTWLWRTGGDGWEWSMRAGTLRGWSWSRTGCDSTRPTSNAGSTASGTGGSCLRAGESCGSPGSMSASDRERSFADVAEALACGGAVQAATVGP